jgi:hypothetical protein
MTYDSSVIIAVELNWALKRSGTIESAMNAFLTTGNISSSSGLGLLQDKGIFYSSEQFQPFLQKMLFYL